MTLFLQSGFIHLATLLVFHPTSFLVTKNITDAPNDRINDFKTVSPALNVSFKLRQVLKVVVNQSFSPSA